MKARQAKKYLKHLSMMSLSPGDTLVFRTPVKIERFELDRLARDLREIFPRNAIIVLGPGESLTSIREDAS